VMLIAISAGLPAPFTPVMILWANLICDIPPALALGIDPAEKNVLRRKPRDPRIGIFSWKSGLLVLVHGFSMAAITLGLFAFGIYVRDYPVSKDPSVPGPARGLAFVGLAVLQLMHAFLARSTLNTAFSKSFLSNKWLLLGVFVSLLSLVGACYIPFLQDVLGQWPLGGWDWLCILVGCVAHIAIVEILKLVFKLRRCHKNTQFGHFYSDV